MGPIEAVPDGCRIRLLITPRAGADRWAGVHDDRLRLLLTASPVEGEANRALIRFLASCFGIPRRDVAIVAGERSRRKTVELRGVTPDRVWEAVDRSR